MASADESIPVPNVTEPETRGGVSPQEAASSAKTTKEPEVLSRYFLVMFQSGNREDTFGGVSRSVLELIQRKLDKVIQTTAPQTEIDLWLESPGGDANAAYKMFLELRSRCRRLWTVIPDRANSAATLLAVGTDRIYMGAAAELSPLDAQIEHPDRENVMISALEVAHALDFLGDSAVKCVLRGGRDIIRTTDLSRAIVLKELLRFAASLFEPVIAKVDPQLTRQATSELRTAQRYARIMLAERNLAEEDQRASLDTDDLAEQLVRHYPAHDFVISRKEAAVLGLPVRPLEGYDHRAAVLALYLRYRSGQLASSDGDTESLIEVFSEEGLRQVVKDVAATQVSEEGDEIGDEPEGNNANPEPRNTESSV